MKVASPLLAGLALCLAAGCQDTTPIYLRYDRPAAYPIPADVRKVAVADFAATPPGSPWGGIAADRLVGLMDTMQKRFGRYTLVDRKHLAAVLDERDLQLAVADDADAVRLGRIAKVDAVVYGAVVTSTKDERVLNPDGAPGLRRTANVQVAYHLVDVRTARVVCARAVVAGYDSASPQPILAAPAGALPPVATVLGRLIDDCNQQFTALISPHFDVSTVYLQVGKTKASRDGNQFAKEGAWADAIELYRRGLREQPDDHATAYNLGLCHEATGDLAQARTWYDKAAHMHPDRKYIKARQRVDRERRLAASAGGKPTVRAIVQPEY